MIHFYKRCVSSLAWLVALLWVRSGWVWVFVSHKPSLFRTKESPLKHKKTKTTNILCPFVLNAHRYILFCTIMCLFMLLFLWIAFQNIFCQQTNFSKHSKVLYKCKKMIKWYTEEILPKCKKEENEIFVWIQNRKDTLRDEISLN